MANNIKDKAVIMLIVKKFHENELLIRTQTLIQFIPLSSIVNKNY